MFFAKTLLLLLFLSNSQVTLLFAVVGLRAVFDYHTEMVGFFHHPGCSAFCLHHPHMAPFGGGGDPRSNFAT